MAALRGSSLPPGAGGGNPFWTNRAQEEWRLRMARPIDLPVPGEDEETRLELEEEEENPPLKDGVGKDRSGGSRGRHMGSSGRWRRSRSRVAVRDDMFITPTSGNAGKGRGEERGEARRSSGLMPESMKSGLDDGRQTEGPDPSTEREAQEALQRVLERGVVEQLHEENARLSEKVNDLLRRLANGNSSSGWSEVTARDEEKGHGREKSPSRRMRNDDDLRYTPNGTQVPSGPPPDEESSQQLPDLPVWPFPRESPYEMAPQSWTHRFMQLGAEEVKLHQEGFGHGMESRHGRVEPAALPEGGIDSRRGQGGCAVLLEGGIHSRQEVLHQDVMSAAQARAAWLERELKSLKEVLETDVRNKGIQQSGYWSNPVWRWDQEDRGRDRALQRDADLRDGRAQQRDADLRDGRAQQRDADLREARALSNDGGCGNGRAPGVSQREERTMEVSHHGRDRGHQQLDGRDLCDPGERKGSAGPSNEKENEALRSSNPVLPILPAVSQKNSAVDAADWLVEIRPLIGDLSTSAADWWNSTMQSTLEVYKVWLASTPLERLRLKPPNPVDSTKFRNGHQIQRLEQRVTTILLPSIPLELRHDLISARQLWPSAILYRILRSYQPGVWGERSMLLTELTVTSAASSAIDASTRLRMWRRHRSRAIELGASLPDVLLQVRALDVIVQGVLKQHPQSQFRVASYRMEANIDERPTDETLAQFLELLTAEMDTLQTGTTEASGMGGEKSGPSVKMIKASGGAPCKFWGSEQGCLKGKNAPIFMTGNPWKIDQRDALFAPACNTASRIVPSVLLPKAQRQKGGVDRVVEMVTKKDVEKEKESQRMEKIKQKEKIKEENPKERVINKFLILLPPSL